jgi:ankyrin repeat protein
MKLHEACYYGHMDIVENLLEDNKNIDTLDEVSLHLLNNFVCYSIIMVLITYLFIYQNGFTPFIKSVQGGRLNIAIYLQSKKSNILFKLKVIYI